MICQYQIFDLTHLCEIGFMNEKKRKNTKKKKGQKKSSKNINYIERIYVSTHEPGQMMPNKIQKSFSSQTETAFIYTQYIKNTKRNRSVLW